MQKRASSDTKQSQKTVFAPLPISVGEPIYYDKAAITLSYSESFPKLHYHDRYEIGICEEGEGLFLVDGAFTSLKSGDLIFIPPHRHHYAHSLHKDHPCKLRFFYILPDALSPLVGSDGESLLRMARIIPPVLRSYEENPMTAILYGIIELREPIAHARERAALLRLSAFLLEAPLYFGAQGDLRLLPMAENDESDIPSQLAEHIALHYNDNEPTASLASAFHMSESQLRRRFAAKYGMPPIAYRNNLRCRIAEEMLLHSQLSVTEIAERTGYATASDFYRAFLKTRGISPSKYRKNK